MTRRLILGLIFLYGCITFASFGAEPEKSVVKITTFTQDPIWDAPWRQESVYEKGGSGFVIDKKRIMTNAHVISWAKQILIRKQGDPRPYPAKVEFVGHDCDLAVLTVDDLSFFDGLEPLAFGTLPKVRSTVVTYGYPAGGDEISYTSGVVSRIEVQQYVHVWNRSFLAVQTDAAINPGNSGGPVIQDGKVVGVAFQGNKNLENMGFFIPPPIIAHFLKDIDDGKYDGFPLAGVGMVPLQNPSYRKFLKMPNNSIGSRIDKIVGSAETQKVLKVDDIILKIKNYDVGRDGKVDYFGNRVASSVVLSEAQNGEKIPLKIWRDGKEMDVELPMSIYSADRIEGNQYDIPPRYFVHGGLVFVPLTVNYLFTFGNDWYSDTPPDLYYELFYRRYDKGVSQRKEAIVLSGVLSHPVNADMAVRSRALIDKINGVKIESLEDVVKAFQNNKGEFDVIEFSTYHWTECLSHKDVETANDQILNTYRISQDRQL